jgi:D-aminoacyl-tRNA deacylase
MKLKVEYRYNPVQILVVASREDAASMNIREKLLASLNWAKCGVFSGSDILRADTEFHKVRLATISDIHIKHDFPEEAWPECEAVVFVTRHKSVSNRRTLTVHPIGNYGAADFGGKAQTLAPSSPALMTQALRNLFKAAQGFDFAVAFEVTHHGPYSEKPVFFIEIGSDETAWKDERAGEAIAKALVSTFSLPLVEAPVCIGIGGGHYAPRQTDMAKSKKISFGHMLPDYQIEGASDDELKRKISMAVSATPGCSCAYVDKKSLGKEVHRIEKILEEIGIKRIRGEDLGNLA